MTCSTNYRRFLEQSLGLIMLMYGGMYLVLIEKCCDESVYDEQGLCEVMVRGMHGFEKEYRRIVKRWPFTFRHPLNQPRITPIDDLQHHSLLSKYLFSIAYCMSSLQVFRNLTSVDYRRCPQRNTIYNREHCYCDTPHLNRLN